MSLQATVTAARCGTGVVVNLTAIERECSARCTQQDLGLASTTRCGSCAGTRFIAPSLELSANFSEAILRSCTFAITFL